MSDATASPETDLILVQLYNYYTDSGSKDSKVVCFKQRQIFTWHNIGFMTSVGDAKNPAVSIPMLSALA